MRHFNLPARRIQLAVFGCAGVLLFPADLKSQTFDLAEYLPYRAGVESGFTPSSGFTFSMGGAGVAAPTFFWLASHPEATLKTHFQVGASGLAVLFREGTTEGEPNDTEDYMPDWIVAPRVVTAGQVVNSSGAYNGFETGHTWTGTTSGTLTVNGLESLAWVAGTSDVLKLTFVNTWDDSDDNSGTTTQTWWMVRHVGVVKLRYDYAETDSEGNEESGTFEFNLTTSTLVAPPQIETQPASQTVTVGSSATFSVTPGGAGPFTYQWRKDEAPIQDETGDAFTIANVQFADADDYDVIVTNPYGSTASGVATLTVQDVPDPATIPDANLVAALRLALNKPTGALTITDLQGLTTFVAINKGITDLTGLEHAVNLQILDLSQNQIGDLAPLSALTRMLHLTLNFNAITDVGPLGAMTLLQQLFLVSNQIGDLSPLATLTALTRISLVRNEITDLAPLAVLTNLTQLDADNNSIADLSPLTSLQNLRILQVAINRIEDISPLAAMPNLIAMNLQNNFITDLSPLAGRTGLTSFLIAANYLDLSPGSPDRLILDAFTAGGTSVFWSPQLVPPVTVLTGAPTPAGGGIQFTWNSQTGFTYQLLTSTDLVNWTPVPGTWVSGNGSAQSVEVPVAAEGSFFFQIDVGLE